MAPNATTRQLSTAEKKDTIMKKTPAALVLGALLVLVLILSLIGWRTSSIVQAGNKPEETRKGPQKEVEKLQAEIKRLQETAPDQAHAMISAAYHFNNLWFAARAKNWPLADFYWGETRSHLRWAVRLIPIRKDRAGRDVDLRAILEAVENSPLKQLQDAIKAKDHEKVVAAYKFTLESCYSCHKAVEKPYLRPQIPQRQAEPIINVDPGADWPK